MGLGPHGARRLPATRGSVRVELPAASAVLVPPPRLPSYPPCGNTFRHLPVAAPASRGDAIRHLPVAAPASTAVARAQPGRLPRSPRATCRLSWRVWWSRRWRCATRHSCAWRSWRRPDTNSPTQWPLLVPTKVPHLSNAHDWAFSPGQMQPFWVQHSTLVP